MSDPLRAATAWNLPRKGNAPAPLLGLGYDPIRMQPAGPSAFDTVDQVSTVASYQQTQVDVMSNVQTVKSALEIAVSGSYSGFKNSMSTAGELALSSSVSQKSISLQLFGIYHTEYKSVDFINAKLSSTAAELLKADPAKFLETYGHGFIGAYICGGYFSGHGVVTINDVNTSANIAGQISGTFKTPASTGTATAAAAFNNIVSENHCTSKFSQAAIGGPGGLPPQTAEALFTNFNAYMASMPAPVGTGTATAVPVGLVWYTWNRLSCVPNDTNWNNPHYPFAVDPSVLTQLTEIWNQLVYLDNTLSNAGPNLVGNFNVAMWTDLSSRLAVMKEKFSSLTLDQLVSLPATFMTEITPPRWFEKACLYLCRGMTLQFSYSFTDGVISGGTGVLNNALFQNSGGTMVLCTASPATHCQLRQDPSGVELVVQWKGEPSWAHSAVLPFNAAPGAFVDCLFEYNKDVFRIFSPAYTPAALTELFGA
jgi:hypothetical protein